MDEILGAAPKTCDTCPRDLKDLVILEQIDKCLDLGLVAGELDDEAVHIDIDDLRPENVCHSDHALALLGCRPYFDQAEFPVNALLRFQFPDVPDIDQLCDLFLDLVEDLLVARGHDGDAAVARI